MGLRISERGFSSFNLCSALTWSARCPRSRRIRLRQCHSIGSVRFGLPPELGHAVVNNRSSIRLCTSTTCIICIMTSVFCTAFSRHFPGIHRPVLNSIRTPSGLSGTGTAAGAATPAPGPPPSSRAEPLRHTVVKRASILRLVDFGFESCAASFRVSLSSLGLREAWHPSVSLCLMRSALLPSRFDSRHTFRDSRDPEEDLLRKNAAVLLRTCAPCAVFHMPSQDWVSPWELLSKASDTSFTAQPVRCFASRTVHSPQS